MHKEKKDGYYIEALVSSSTGNSWFVFVPF